MNSRPLPLLFAAALAFPSLPASAQDDRKPAPPTPPPAPEAAQRPPQPDRPPGQPQPQPQPGHNGPRDEHRDDRRDGRGEGRGGDQRHDGQRGPEENRRGEDGPRRDGDRGPGGPGKSGGPGGPGASGGPGAPGGPGGGPGGPGRDRGWNIPLPPPPAPLPTPYLGVVTLPPPAVLGAQLGLKEGFGLVVTEILPDSPAAKAGIKKYDVLTKFNDQQLVDGGQFATLVRGAGKDADASITLFRTGKEQTVPVKVGERMAPPRMPFPGGAELREHMDRLRGPAQDGFNKMRDRMKDYGDKMREYQDRFKGWQKNPTADMPQPPAPPTESENGAYQITPADVLMHAQPGGTRQIRIIQPNGAVSFYTADAKMFLKDESGDVEVTTKDGKRMLVAKDAKGETVFDGPIDTEEQRKSLPEDVRKKIEQIFVRANAPTPLEASVQVPVPEGDVQ